MHACLLVNPTWYSSCKVNFPVLQWGTERSYAVRGKWSYGHFGSHLKHSYRLFWGHQLSTNFCCFYMRTCCFIHSLACSTTTALALSLSLRHRHWSWVHKINQARTQLGEIHHLVYEVACIAVVSSDISGWLWSSLTGLISTLATAAWCHVAFS